MLEVIQSRNQGWDMGGVGGEGDGDGQDVETKSILIT